MVKIIVLNDNRKNSDEFENEHGISLYIEAYGTRILLDAGRTEIFKNNAKKLGINLDNLDAIILSHGHYDHGDGLKYIDEKTKLICHPECNNYRRSKRTKKFGGINQSKEELAYKFELIPSAKPYEIVENIFYLGQIERNNDFEAKTFPMTIEDGSDDVVLDDTGIAIKTANGLIVLSGCAHSGICNTVEYAKKITKEERVLAVIGGFHLKEIDEATNKTINYMIDNNVENIYLAHCTSDEVCEEFEKCIPNKAKTIKVREEYIF